MIVIDEYTNTELEEMGVKTCACLATYNEVDDSTQEVYIVCADCGASRNLGRRVPAWS